MIGVQLVDRRMQEAPPRTYGLVLGRQYICLTLQAMRVPGKAALAAMCVDESPVKSRWVPAESRTLFAPLGLSSVLRGST